MDERNENQDPIGEIVRVACEMTGWTEQEARNFMSCVRSDTKEGLVDAIGDALELARLTETRAAAIDLMKQLGRILEVTMRDGDIAIRFSPEIGVVKLGDGFAMDIDFSPIASRP